MMIGNAKCDVMRTQELVNVVVVPTLVAKLERVRITARQHVEEGRQTLAVLGKLRRKLKQHGSDLGRQRLKSSLHQLYRVRAVLVQPLPMSNELRRLPCEQEILRGLVPPCFYSLQRGRSIERAINLGGRKLSSVPAKPFGFRDVRGVERTPPAFIGPARRADPHLAHQCTPLGVPRAVQKNRRRPLGLPLLELFRHAQMFLKMRERLAGPGFQLGIFTAF